MPPCPIPVVTGVCLERDAVVYIGISLNMWLLTVVAEVTRGGAMRGRGQ